MEVILYRAGKAIFVDEGEVYIAHKATGIEGIRAIETIPDMEPAEKRKTIEHMYRVVGLSA